MHVFTVFFIKVKTCFLYIFYLQINVFNIYYRRRPFAFKQQFRVMDYVIFVRVTDERKCNSIIIRTFVHQARRTTLCNKCKGRDRDRVKMP